MYYASSGVYNKSVAARGLARSAPPADWITLGFYNRTEDERMPPSASVADDAFDVAVYASPFAGDAAFPDPPLRAAISPSTASARSVR
jgi:hypothetical protein